MASAEQGVLPGASARREQPQQGGYLLPSVPQLRLVPRPLVAKGVLDSGDSKDEESSSEDVMFAYGLKMLGRVIGNKAMEARGNLMLATLSRS